MLNPRAIALALGLGLASSAAMADSVTGTPGNFFAGGGCFNFMMNGVQYSMPNVGIGSGIEPRGGQASINDWKSLILRGGPVTFNRGDAVKQEVCGLGGYSVDSVFAAQ